MTGPSNRKKRKDEEDAAEPQQRAAKAKKEKTRNKRDVDEGGRRLGRRVVVAYKHVNHRPTQCLPTRAFPRFHAPASDVSGGCIPSSDSSGPLLPPPFFPVVLRTLLLLLLLLLFVARWI